MLINCTAVLRGVSRAVGSIATNSNSTTDLVSLVWNGLLGPFLSHSANYLVLVRILPSTHVFLLCLYILCK